MVLFGLYLNTPMYGIFGYIGVLAGVNVGI